MIEDRDNIQGGIRGSKSRWLVRIVVTLVLLAAAVIVAALLQPPRYFAKVTMEVKREGAPEGYDPEFVAEQFELMRRTEILYPVIERLDLRKSFAKGAEPLPLAEVYRLLLRSLDFREVRNTGLIEVGVYSSHPQLAANIANTIAVVYKEKGLLDFEQKRLRRFAQMDEDNRNQAKRTEQLLAEAAKTQAQEGITDPDPENYGTTIAAPNGKESAALYAEAKARYLQQRKHVEYLQANLQHARIQMIHHADPAKIWEKAEPPREPVRFWFPRFW